jgi:hypothetical protein
LIPVTPQPEPEGFDDHVRKPGESFLEVNPEPTNKQFSKRNFWKRVAGDLHAAYNGICAYTCSLLVHSGSVDHFKPKSKYPKLAYEWSNYRLAHPLANQNKADSTDVVDPFIIKEGWFTLEFPGCLVRPGINLGQNLAERVNKTIITLKLNENDRYVQERCDVMMDYKNGLITMDFLSRRYPFLATEIKRQNIQESLGDIFKKRTK